MLHGSEGEKELTPCLTPRATQLLLYTRFVLFLHVPLYKDCVQVRKDACNAMFIFKKIMYDRTHA